MHRLIVPSADSPAVPSAAVDYPSSDGKPLAENHAQLHAILYAEEHAAHQEETAARQAAELRAGREAVARREEAAARRAAEARVAELEARLGARC